MKYDNPLDERDLLDREHADRMEDLEQQHYDEERDMRREREDEIDAAVARVEAQQEMDADALRDDAAGFVARGLGL